MFDDQASNQGQTPNNLPVGEPEDMLAGIEKDETAVASEANEETTLGTAQPSALGAGILKPKVDTVAPATPNFPEAAASQPVGEEQTPATPQLEPATGMPNGPDMYPVKEPTLTRGLVMAIIITVVVVILGGGGWWIYTSFIASPDQDLTVPVPVEPAGDLAPVPVEPVAQPLEPVEEDLSADIIDEQILFGEPIDKDGDGLDDNREFDLGTDASNWDSDGDELGDGDEVIIWKTDPLNPDSDGDSYLDGQEVKSGYNPAGSGKIFEPPSE